MGKDQEDWNDYRRLILSKLEEQGTDIKDIQNKVNDVSGRLGILEANLKVKTALAGSLFGGLAAIVFNLLGL